MISSSRLVLRALEKHDLEFLHTLHNSFQNMSYFFEEPFETLRELEELFEKHLHNPSERRFVVELRNEPTRVGVLSLVEIDDINRNAEVDIIVSEHFRGKGLGKEAFLLAVKYAFDVLNLYKLYLEVLPTNSFGRRIYEHFGFREESLLREHYFVDGKYVDAVRMCLFEKDWHPTKRAFYREFGIDVPTDSLIVELPRLLENGGPVLAD